MTLSGQGKLNRDPAIWRKRKWNLYLKVSVVVVGVFGFSDLHGHPWLLHKLTCCQRQITQHALAAAPQNLLQDLRSSMMKNYMHTNNLILCNLMAYYLNYILINIYNTVHKNAILYIYISHLPLLTFSHRGLSSSCMSMSSM